MNNEYISIKEAAAILNKSPQAIYQSKTLSQYIKVIDNKKVILRAAIQEDNKPVSNSNNDLISHYEKLLSTYEQEIEILRQENIRKDKLIEELATNASELNKRFSTLLQHEQSKERLINLENPLNNVVQEPFKEVEPEEPEKPRRKRFFGLF